MIHFFNPGHEAAVLNASKYYQPPLSVRTMQRDLAYLPAWYAAPEDFVFVPCHSDESQNPLTATRHSDESQNPLTATRHSDESQNPLFSRSIITINDLAHRKDELRGQTIDLWGLSPQSIHFFEQLNEKYALDWKVPAWKDEYRALSSRHTSAECLAFLIENLPEIDVAVLPHFYSDISGIEEMIKNTDAKMLVKSPFSSSGRGLIWLPPTGVLARSEKQILTGMLKKQKAVSIEKALEKVLDFSLHFEIKNTDDVAERSRSEVAERSRSEVAERSRSAVFLGYSVFYTNTKGAYEKSLLAPQSFLEEKITQYIDVSLIKKIKGLLMEFIKQRYLSVYIGCIGVDMLIYKNGENYALQPCVEINMRKSMGYLAIKLFEKYIDNNSVGYFFVQHSKSFEQKTPVFENKRLKSGSLMLCPLTAESNYMAYLQISSV
ncbi:hypothetical protein FACS18945_1490 [Bacteroidia bacterium]|nr:hypothetical protein FACS18945_1490 [Bacteroidia bacterium]